MRREVITQLQVIPQLNVEGSARCMMVMTQNLTIMKAFLALPDKMKLAYYNVLTCVTIIINLLCFIGFMFFLLYCVFIYLFPLYLYILHYYVSIFYCLNILLIFFHYVYCFYIYERFQVPQLVILLRDFFLIMFIAFFT